MKKHSHVLVVSKTTCLMEMQERNDVDGLRLVEQRHVSVAGVRETHETHLSTLRLVETELDRRGITYSSIIRRAFKGAIPDCVDLVITVGGDGSFIDTSHFITNKVPVLGVNSAPSSSHGHFCLAGPGNFIEVLDSILAGRVRPLSLTRLEMILNGERLPLPVMNEVLVCDRDPSATSRYLLQIGGASERQKSSGVLVGTPSGSTGFLRSEGGAVQPIAARAYQYLVRAPFADAGEEVLLARGLLAAEQEVRIVSGMPDGVICVDGKYIKFDFPRGSDLIIRPADCDLSAYVDLRCHDRYVKPQIAERLPGRRLSLVRQFSDWLCRMCASSSGQR